jgi:hypothetical protein
MHCPLIKKLTGRVLKYLMFPNHLDSSLILSYPLLEELLCKHRSATSIPTTTLTQILSPKNTKGLRYSEPLGSDSMTSNSDADSERSAEAPSSEPPPSLSQESSELESSGSEASESPPTVSLPLLLTFGIEFEYFLLYKQDWYEQNLPNYLKMASPAGRTTLTSYSP